MLSLPEIFALTIAPSGAHNIHLTLLGCLLLLDNQVEDAFEQPNY
jgi:hypothetical protein